MPPLARPPARGGSPEGKEEEERGGGITANVESLAGKMQWRSVL